MVTNEKVSSFLGKLLILAILVAAYFGVPYIPHYMDYQNVRQKAINVYRHKDMAVPAFTKEEKEKLIKELVQYMDKELNVKIKPKEIVFNTKKGTEPYLAFSYKVQVKWYFVERYTEHTFDIYISGNP